MTADEVGFLRAAHYGCFWWVPSRLPAAWSGYPLRIFNPLRWEAFLVGLAFSGWLWIRRRRGLWTSSTSSQVARTLIRLGPL